MPPIVVHAPATSANLGSGFDCLGLALDLWSEVSATPGGGQPADDNLIVRAARALFEHVGAEYPGFQLSCTNRIPFGRGLGSSSAAIVSGLLVANECLNQPLSQAELLQLADRLEGHPDNVAACLLGGVRVATIDQHGRVLQAHVPLAAALQAVVYVPERSVATVDARRLLPNSVPLADALFNVARSSLLIAALASGQLDLLAEATRDRLHQSYRLPLFTAGPRLLEDALHAGALAAFISGAGPSVLTLCADAPQAERVAAALEHSARGLQVSGQSLRLALTEHGARVVG